MYGMRLSIVGVPQLYYLSAYLCVLIVIFFYPYIELLYLSLMTSLNALSYF